MPLSGSEQRLSEEVAAFVCSGVAVSVATRNGDLRPAFTRAWGPRLSEDGQTLTLCVIAPAGSATRAGLEQNGAIAIGFSPPTAARAVQVKGTAVEIRDPERDELECAERHLAAFCVETASIGYPADLARRLYSPVDFVSVTLSIDEVFDQTPGPAAGRRV
jgi:hypothetical protein